MASTGSASSNGGGAADRYASALYSLADEQRSLDETVEAMTALGRLIDDSAAFRRLLASPLIDVQQGRAAADAILEQQGFSPLIRRFVGVVAGNRRLGLLRTIVARFASLVADRRGVVTAEVATAHALSDVQRESLRARLIEAGYGHVNITERVDPALLGGIAVRIGARLFDASLRSRLQRLKYAMGAA